MARPALESRQRSHDLARALLGRRRRRILHVARWLGIAPLASRSRLLPHLHSSGADRCRFRRTGSRAARHCAQRHAWRLACSASTHLTHPAMLEAVIFAIVGAGISWFGEQLRRTQDPRAASHAARPAGARSASPLDPRYRSRRDRRHRREGHHPIVQRRGRAPVRLPANPPSSARMSAC